MVSSSFLLPLLLVLMSTPLATDAAEKAGSKASAIIVEAPETDRVVVPAGAARGLTVEDFRPHERASNSFSEVWTYVFLLNDGMQATFSLSQANLGRIMGSVSGAEFAISGFDGQSFRAPKEYAAENFAYSPSSHRLQVHPNIFVEGQLPQRHRIQFHAAKHGVDYEVELSLTDIAPGFTWGDGVFHLGPHRMGMFIHIPFARVSGTVKIGEVTKRVTGTAYMDHTYQTDFAPKLVSSAYRYIQHGQRPEVGYFILPASRYEERVIGIGGVREGGRFRLNRPASMDVISTRASRGVEIPHQLAISFDGGGQTILNRQRDQQAFSVLEELSSIQRGVVKRFVGGEAYVFRGRGTTNLREPVVYEYLVVR